MNTEGIMKTDFKRRSLNYKERKREVTWVQRLVSIRARALGVSRDPAPPEHRPDGVHILGWPIYWVSGLPGWGVGGHDPAHPGPDGWPPQSYIWRRKAGIKSNAQNIPLRCLSSTHEVFCAPHTQLLIITNRQSPPFQRRQKGKTCKWWLSAKSEELESLRVNDSQLLHTSLLLDTTAFHPSSPWWS